MSYIRRRCGKGFTYLDHKGNTVNDPKMREWFNSMAIPPAWSDVEIAANKNSDLLATGRDEKGRKQYIYSEAYHRKNAAKKFNRIIRFAEKLDIMRSVTEEHLKDKLLTKRKVLATMVRLMDEAYFRTGSTNYTQNNGTYGLTTLRSRHLTINDDTISFTYTGKSGQQQKKIIEDKQLIEILKDLDEIPGYRIFKYYDEGNIKRNIEGDELNNYIRNIMGERFSAKDFRTWAGTLLVAIELDNVCDVDKNDQKSVEKAIRQAILSVSLKLGNTPAIAKSSYIDPRIIESFINGNTIKSYIDSKNNVSVDYKYLDVKEIAVLHILNSY